MKRESEAKGLETRLLQPNEPGAIATAGRLFKGGGLIVYPTDTVYGLGADAWSAAAIAKMYEVKQRPSRKGIPILIADFDDLERVCRNIPARAQELIERFWPGPLTLILPRHDSIPNVLAPGDTVAVRIPGDELSRAVIRAAGGALATTSANLSGQPPATSAAEAMTALGGLVDAVIDGGRSPYNEASTIVGWERDTLSIVREGPISAADLGLSGPTA